MKNTGEKTKKLILTLNGVIVQIIMGARFSRPCVPSQFELKLYIT